MIVLKGTIHKGQIVLARPAELPDGTEVTVLSHGPGRAVGIPDNEWPTDSDGIARLLERMRRAEPFEMTPEEEADTASWRQQVKEYTLANQDKAIDGLFE